MAINPETEFVGKISPASADYPFGEARNITIPGDGTGTPLLASLVNDLFGLQQALLNAVGAVPSGTPDKVGASQYLDAILSIAARRFDLVPTMLGANALKVGMVVRTDDFGATNDGGGSWYRIVLETSVTVNGATIIQGTGVNVLLAFVLIADGALNVAKVGALGLADAAANVQAAITLTRDIYIAESDTITSGLITLPDDLRFRIDGSLKSKININGPLLENVDTAAGNTNIHITGKGDIDGNKANQASGDNYAIRLEKVSDSVIDVARVHDAKLFTVPGNEGAVYLVNCTDVVVVGTESDNNDGTGILGVDCVRCGSVRTHTHDGAASGVIWDKGEDNYCDHDHSHDNVFSNMNHTGKRGTFAFCDSHDAGFSNFNFGESGDPLKAADGGKMYGCTTRTATLDGVSVQRGDDITIQTTDLEANVRHNIRVFGNAGKVTLLKVTAKGATGANANGAIFEVGEDHFIGDNSEFSGNGLRGIEFSGTAKRSRVHSSTKAFNNGQVTSGNSAGIFVNSPSSEIDIGGEYYDTQTGVETQESGVWNGGGDAIIYNGFSVRDNKTNQIRETAGPTRTTKIKIRLGLDPLGGSFFAAAGITTVVLNDNSEDVQRIEIRPGNNAARLLGSPNATVITSGQDFTVNHAAAAGGSTELFYYEIL